ncbi:MAG: acyl-CoA dehydrogenase family protein, partial [Chloroflexi bacterium]|nr:acyl-CoA dehydrogenase family protein [Chloroflexota bacterium]
MEFRWTEEEEEFRQEIRDLLDKELPPDWQQHAGEDDSPERADFEKAFAGKMGQRGWLTVGWPKEYGGMGWTPLQQMIFNEEMSLHKAPRRYMGAGVSLAGPSIMTHGSDEQKKRFLPPIAHGEVIWCQLFSEPNAGSDLASLQTTAVEDGDDFVVNGTKIWSSMAHKADWGALMCRTDPDAPKHKGISYLVVDMK